MNSFQYAEAMARVKQMPEGPDRREAWRQAKTARQVYLENQRKLRDPDWYLRKRDRENERRRLRAANDPAYRELRNRQSR